MTAGNAVETWETPSCISCGSTDRSRVRTWRTSLGVWCVVRCRQCGLLYTCPRPHAAELAKMYGEAYYQVEYDAYEATDTLLGDAREIVADLRRRRPAAKSLLDIGCGSGSIVAAADGAGLRSLGTELSEWAVEQARRRYSVRVVVGSVESLDLDEGPFDLIVMWQVLEHVANPRLTLVRVRDLLADDGLLLITVPNVNALGRWLKGGSWAGWKPGHHLYHFSLESLSQLLRGAGWELEESDTHLPISLKSAANMSPIVAAFRNRMRPLLSRPKRALAWCLGRMFLGGDSLFVYVRKRGEV